MSAVIDFTTQPFSGIGDPRTVQYRRFMENKVQQHLFAPFSEQGFILPNLQADLDLMERLKAQERAAYAYQSSPAAMERVALEEAVAANDGVATPVQQLQLEALAPLAHQRQLTADQRELLKSLRVQHQVGGALFEGY